MTMIQGSVTILPFIKRDKAYQIIQNLVPDLSYQQVNEGMPFQVSQTLLMPSIIVIAMAGIGCYFGINYYCYLRL